MTIAQWTATPILLATLFLGSQADAKNLQGRLGLGLEQSISGVSGLTVRYWSGERVGLHATVGGGVATGVGENGDEIGTSIGASVGMIYNVARALHANLGIGVRAAVGMRNEALRNALDNSGDPQRNGDDLQFNLEFPIVIEYFLSESFSVSVASGFLLVFVPSDGAVLSPKGHGGSSIPDTMAIGIGAGSITGSLGAVFYF
jgi:hypothetical protein